MATDARLVLVLLGAVAAAPAAGGENALLTLLHNPFTRPQILKPKPPPPPAPAPRAELPAEPVVLELSATLVSPVAPLAVVDGELLAIGDTIEGFRLVAVLEGKAVFVRGGRKHVFEIASGNKK